MNIICLELHAPIREVTCLYKWIITHLTVKVLYYNWITRYSLLDSMVAFDKKSKFFNTSETVSKVVVFGNVIGQCCKTLKSMFFRSIKHGQELLREKHWKVADPLNNHTPSIAIIIPNATWDRIADSTHGRDGWIPSSPTWNAPISLCSERCIQSCDKNVYITSINLTAYLLLVLITPDLYRDVNALWGKYLKTGKICMNR